MVYGVGGGLNRLLGFLFLPLFTSYLTPTDYGISSILGAMAFLITPLFSLGFGAAIGVPYFESEQAARKVATIWTAACMLLISVLLMLSAAAAFASQLSQLLFETTKYDNLVFISLLSTGLTILSTPFTLRVQFEERVHQFVILSFLSSIATMGTTIWKVVVLRQGVLGLLQATLIGQLVTLVLFIIVCIPRMPLRLDGKIAGELLRLGVPLIPSFAFLFVLQHGNKYILQWFYGLDTVGVYTIGFNLGMFMSLPVTAFQNAWYPYFMSFMDRKDEAAAVFGRVLMYYVLGMGGLSLLFFIFAGPLVRLMTQPVFHAAYQVVGFAACSQFLMGLSSILLPGMYFAKKVQYVTLVQLVAAALSIPIVIIFTHLYGMLGAALALPVAMLVMNVVQVLWNRYQHSMQVAYEIRPLIRFTAAYLLIAVAALLAARLSFPLQITSSLVLSVCACVGLTGILSAEDRSTIYRLITRFVSQRLRGNPDSK